MHLDIDFAKRPIVPYPDLERAVFIAGRSQFPARLLAGRIVREDSCQRAYRPGQKVRLAMGLSPQCMRRPLCGPTATSADGAGWMKDLCRRQRRDLCSSPRSPVIRSSVLPCFAPVAGEETLQCGALTLPSTTSGPRSQ